MAVQLESVRLDPIAISAYSNFNPTVSDNDMLTILLE